MRSKCVKKISIELIRTMNGDSNGCFLIIICSLLKTERYKKTQCSIGNKATRLEERAAFLVTRQWAGVNLAISTKI